MNTTTGYDTRGTTPRDPFARNRPLADAAPPAGDGTGGPSPSGIATSSVGLMANALADAVSGIAALTATLADAIATSYVVVQPGDSLSAIAAANGVDWRELYELNRGVIGDDPDRIEPGMRLLLPGSTAAAMLGQSAPGAGATTTTATGTTSGGADATGGAGAAPPDTIEPTTSRGASATAGTTAGASNLPSRDELVSQIRDLLISRGSPMADSVEALVDSSLAHGVDPRIMVAIAGQESEFGTTNPESLANNPFGFFWNGGVDSPFASWEEGYERVATRLGEMINDQGFTSVFELGEGDPSAANDGYCEVGASNDPTGLNSGWIGGVSAMYRELGGNPEDVSIGGAAPASDGDVGGAGAATAPAAEAAGGGSSQWISQAQGQATQWEDCGPASLVMALLRMGVTPHEWDPANPAAAIERVREDMGLQRGVETGGTNEGQVRAALATYDIAGETSGDWNALLQHVRSGRPVVLAGNTRSLPYAVNVKDNETGVFHFLTVSGYDPATGLYEVLDPIAIEPGPKYLTADQLHAYFDVPPYGQAGVMV